MPAAVAIPAAISAGTSILGGVLGSRAASKAGKLQAEAAAKQAADFKAVLAQYNPQIGATAETAAQNVTGATTAGQEAITGAVGTGQTGIKTATQQAMELLQPYIGAGGEALTNLRQLMAPGGDLTKGFTAADMQQYDPGYAFRIDQANKALQGSAAARGGALGGGTLSALASLNQNLASSEFGAAEQRFRAQQTDRFNRLNTLVNLGATTATTAGGYGMTGASRAADLGLTGATSAADLGYRGATTAGGFTTQAAQEQAANALGTQRSIADLMTGGAAAQAAGTVGAANAWTGALSGVAGAAGGVGRYYQDRETLRTIMQNPALKNNLQNLWNLPTQNVPPSLRNLYPYPTGPV
jgi:hypothetical protein